MRSLRLLLIPILAGLPLLAAATPAQAAGVWIEVTPGTITAGYQIALRANCGDNSNSATVHSKAFGTVTVQPYNSYLYAEAQVLGTVHPGGYPVKLTCRTGSTATTTLWVIPSERPNPTKGPHTGGGFLANGGSPTNPGTAWLLGGAGALTAGLGIGLVAVRRRSTLRA